MCARLSIEDGGAIVLKDLEPLPDTVRVVIISAGDWLVVKASFTA
jgi:hypothetical protein